MIHWFDTLAEIMVAERRDTGCDLPPSFAQSAAGGQSVIRLWREQRGYSRAYLAEKVGLASTLLATLETNPGVWSPMAYDSLADGLERMADRVLPA